MKPGDRVLSYIVDRELGEGGMGTVFLGRHTVLNQQVAIKALSPLLSRDQALRERFIQEANIQAGLRHPGIVQVLTAEMEGEQPSLVMEYIDGKSLSEVLEFRGALPIDDALKIMEQVLSAVGYAHRQGVIHRDLKPSNVMVMASGEAKVTDFGIAKVLGSTKLTRTGTAMGSAHYMSPEQIRRPETVDARSDVYSLGCVFYEVLTGRPPFGEKDASGTESDFEIKTSHVTESAPPLNHVAKRIPHWLTQLVMMMLEKELDKRPVSCEAILEQLKAGNTAGDTQYHQTSVKSNEVQTVLTIKPQFDDASDFSEGLAAVRIGDEKTGKYGFINKAGKMVIPLQFDHVLNFSEGLAAVRIGDEETGKYGFINKEGEMVISPKFDYAVGFVEGLSAVKMTGKYGFINKEEKIVVSPQFDYAGIFSEGLAAVQINDGTNCEWGYINKEGKIVISPQFYDANNFSEGLAVVSIDRGNAFERQFINKEGKVVFSHLHQFEFLCNFSEGLATASTIDGINFYMNKEGKVVFSHQFDFALGFSDGLALVGFGDNQASKSGYIDKEGKIVIAIQFDHAHNFSEGLAAVRIGDEETGKYGFINKEGKMVINP